MRTFKDRPEFTPNVSPRQMFQLGVFGGTYWRPIHSIVTGKNYSKVHLRYKSLAGLDRAGAHNMLSAGEYDVTKNYFEAKCGSSLIEWENSGWIHPQDPYGWVQWYTAFYEGRRSDDDDRQIGRWLRFAGPNGRFSSRRGEHSARVKQSLLHWAVLS